MSWRRVATAGATAGLTAAAVLTGAGTAAARPSGPVLAFAPSPYSYGKVAPGRAGSRTFTLANTGGQGTGALRVRLAGPASFTITRDTCTSLGPGKTCTVAVQFAPARAGLVTATLTAVGNKRGATTDALTGKGKGLGSAPGHVYWASNGNGTIWAANLDGSDPRAIIPGQNQPIGVAADASHLYWTSVTANGGTINEANLDGSDPQAIITGLDDPEGLAVDASHLYWADDDQGTVNEANLDGTNPHAIVTGQSFPFGLAVGGGHLYWATTGLLVVGAGKIWEASLDGTNAHAIVTGQNGPQGVAVDASHLYWANAEDGTIQGANLDGTDPHAILSTLGPSGVAVSASHLYWTTGTDDAAHLANLDGSSPQVIASGQAGPLLMAVTPPPPSARHRPRPELPFHVAVHP